jgi:hypothetical protein
MAYAERRRICDAEYKHADGSITRWHKAFSSKGQAEGAYAWREQRRRNHQLKKVK